MDDPTVRSALRVLEVLEALNDRRVSTVAMLQARTGLPKPTIVRLMQTLVGAGYARQLSRAGGYALAERVLRLAEGFQYTDRVTLAARPYVDAFTAAQKWPAIIQVYDQGAMLRLYSARKESPLVFDPPSISRRSHMLSTAHGLVYCAFCADAEFEMILAMLKASEDPADSVALDDRYVSKTIEDVRRKGYALRAARPGDRVIGFAVPILENGHAVATVGMRYAKMSMTAKEAVQRYLEPLKALAEAISADLRAPHLESELA